MSFLHESLLCGGLAGWGRQHGFMQRRSRRGLRTTNWPLSQPDRRELQQPRAFRFSQKILRETLTNKRHVFAAVNSRIGTLFL